MALMLHFLQMVPVGVLIYGIPNVCLFNGMGLIWLIKFTSNQLKQAIKMNLKSVKTGNITPIKILISVQNIGRIQ